MAGQVNLKEKYKYFKKKRNLLLFFTYGTLILTVIPPIVLLSVKRYFDIWASLFLVLLMAGLFLVVWLRQKINVYNMYYHYYKMLLNNKGILKLQEKIYTTSWINKIKTDGFEIGYDDNDLVIYRKYVKRDKLATSIKETELLIMIAKKKDIDMFSNQTQEKIDMIERNPKERLKRSLVLQFQKHNNFNEETIDKLNQIINIRNHSMYQVHISIGYVEETKEIYFLDPVKMYPNKYYFAATRLIYQICNIKDGD